MTRNIPWFLLQIFAGDGGEGGEGATSGDTAADAGQQLRDLGVPEDKIRKHMARARKAAPEVRTPAAEQKPAVDAAPAEQKEPDQEESPKRMTWDEIKADPEYNKEIQNLVKKRLKASNDALDALKPALELVRKHYGLEGEQMDYAAIAQKIVDDDQYYEDRAAELGSSVEMVKKLDQQQAELNRFRQQEAETLEQQKIMDHIRNLQEQGEAMKEIFPGFDLQTELQNPVFARMTAPDSGISVEDAYYAVHRKQIQAIQSKVVADQVTKKVASSIRANAARPDESGSQQGSSTLTFDYSKASRETRENLKARIRRGEKIFPGREFG